MIGLVGKRSAFGEGNLNMPSEGKFNGRVALITGAARGIGKAIAFKMSREGASVALMDVDERVQDVARDLTGKGIPAVAFTVDVGDEQAVHDAVAGIANRFSRKMLPMQWHFWLPKRPVSLQVRPYLYAED